MCLCALEDFAYRYISGDVIHYNKNLTSFNSDSKPWLKTSLSHDRFEDFYSRSLINQAANCVAESVLARSASR